MADTRTIQTLPPLIFSPRRGLQFGAWSPTFTSWGNGGMNNDWWLIQEPYLSAMRKSV